MNKKGQQQFYLSSILGSIFCCSLRLCVSAVLLLTFSLNLLAQDGLENRPLGETEIVFEGSGPDQIAAEQYKSMVNSVLGDEYSTVKVRDALEVLFKSERVASARVEAENGNNSVRLRFVIKRKNVIDRVFVNVAPSIGDNPVTEEELLSRINLVNQGAVVSEQAINNSADAIQTYLRERGFFNAKVEPRQEPTNRDTRINVIFNVRPETQAKVDTFAININGFEPGNLPTKLNLKKGEYYSRRQLNTDVERIRRELLDKGYLAPTISEPRISFDPENNLIDIEISGTVGPKVKINTSEIKLSSSEQRELFPVRREGGLDQSAIEEGARRLRNRLQERGYFFAEVSYVCSVNPLPKFEEGNAIPNNSTVMCESLTALDLTGREVEIDYQLDLIRKFRLVGIRIEGTDKLPIEEIREVLRTREANILGIIPRLGYGRGFTSNELLDEDKQTIQSLMRELGYRQAKVTVRQGVSVDGENLIITFDVQEGPLTRVADVEIVGNQAVPTNILENQLPEIEGKPYSRARARTGNDQILNYYAKEGYIDARVNFSLVEVPSNTTGNQTESFVKIVYTVENEGKKTFVNRILPVGNEKTKNSAILGSIPLRSGELLRADLLAQSEQNLYATDAFRSINFQTEPAGERPNGDQQRDIIINLEENQPRILTYGGGYSTENGPLGFVDIRHVNLLGKLYQGGARARVSRLQQLLQVDFTNPRAFPDGQNRFAPLVFSAQYLRDTSVTRFFRSTIDRGTFGIVQRLDENGNPIDEFGNPTGAPAINRFTIQAETSRTINRATRSILFVRARYEDVRLFNINSLLVAPLLRPDRVVRLSGFGATFARDTRENCNPRFSLLQRIRTGDVTEPCRYNPSDPTRGAYLTVDYSLSTKWLGGNISFNKIQLNYQRYYQIKALKKTVLAGRLNLGLASLFNVRDRDGNGQIDENDRILPISERFFAGGSTTLRGFDFEEAGPRSVIIPQGTFRDRNGNLINLSPFTVPLGGNALAIANLEARIPITNSFQVVPFYDGGNVFRRISEIFKPRSVLEGDIVNQNLKTVWTNTVGLGVRIKSPVGFGSIAIDFGYLLNPPEFVIPQRTPPNGIFRLHQSRLHFRFTQAF